MKVPITLVPGGKVPTYAHEGDAGMDCYARLGPTRFGAHFAPSSTALSKWISDELCSGKHKIARIPLGFRVAIPAGYYLELTCKSGLGFKGLQVIPGIIDSGYRGEVHAQVWALEPVTIDAGQKICQAILKPCVKAELETVDELGDTSRGEGGFGSTGA